MRGHRDHLRWVGSHLGMFIVQPTYSSVVAYLTGYADGAQVDLWADFHSWLVNRLGRRDSRYFGSLALEVLLGPDASLPLAPTDDERAVAGLFQLVDEYLSERPEHAPADVADDNGDDSAGRTPPA